MPLRTLRSTFCSRMSSHSAQIARQTTIKAAQAHAVLTEGPIMSVCVTTGRSIHCARSTLHRRFVQSVGVGCAPTQESV